MSTARRLHHSYDEYLRVLEISMVKLEYCDGEIYAMASGTPAHAELAAAIGRLVGNALLGRCSVYSSDLKVRIEATGLSTFPDASVVCGNRELSPIDRNAVVNPTLLIEVTSPSTEDYDRGEKVSQYKQLPSLRAVLLISHRRPQVTVVERTDDGWKEREVRSGEWVVLAAPKAARNSTLGARMAAQIGRYVTCRVSLRRVLAGRCGLDHLASTHQSPAFPSAR